MESLENKKVIVVGLGLSGQAACDLLLLRGAKVTAVDAGHNRGLEECSKSLASRGVAVFLKTSDVSPLDFDLAVVSPGVPPTFPLLISLKQKNIPTIGEFELGCQHSLCLNVAITGTNGKTTTTELVSRMLTSCGRKTVAAGNIGLPVCSVVEQTRDLDYLTLEVSSFQLETIRYFRPMVAVLLNITPDHLDRYDSMENYALAKAQLFKNQQVFDWAIVQYEALEQLKKMGVQPRSKVITFSAGDQRADIFFDRGLLISRLEGWEGPLLNMDAVRLAGPHNAENIMATLAVGRVLRLPLEQTLAAVKSYEPASHRCEILGEFQGVQFVNDSKATNVDATVRALMTMRTRPDGSPNVILIAGGKDKGFDYHDAGPWISKRVKAVFLIGETAEKIRAAWSLFTPCTVMDSLLEAVSKAAEKASSGDVVLLSPACSSFDQFQNYQHRGEVFREAVARLSSSTCWGDHKTATSSSGGEPVMIL